MNCANKSTRRWCNRGERSQAGFTLAEVLAAMLFMAIVIPVAIQGLRVATMAGEVAARKGEAVRVAEKILNENLITTNWNQGGQSGNIQEGDLVFRYDVQNEPWEMDSTQYAPRLVWVQVWYKVRDQEYSVRLSTLANLPEL